MDLSRHPVFTRRVLECVTGIAYGHTMTYGEVAAVLGKPRAAGAVRRWDATLFPAGALSPRGGQPGMGGFSAPGAETKGICCI